MAEFGHTYATAGNVHIDTWGVGPFKIELAPLGKSFIFEDSDRFGPVPLKKNGWEIRAPGFFAESSQFWSAWEKWVEQGRRIADDGKTCVWDADKALSVSTFTKED